MSVMEPWFAEAMIVLSIVAGCGVTVWLITCHLVPFLDGWSVTRRHNRCLRDKRRESETDL